MQKHNQITKMILEVVLSVIVQVSLVERVNF